MTDRPEEPAGQAPRPKAEEGPRADPECGDFGIRIARDGTWFYHGSPIGRKPLVRLFSTVLHRDEEGDFWLITPAERGRIVVEDAPFVAVEMRADGAGESQVLSFRTNVDDWVRADADHPLRVAVDPASGEPSPYLVVRGRLEALIARSVFYELAGLAVERRRGDDHVLGVWSAGAFFLLGKADGSEA